MTEIVYCPNCRVNVVPKHTEYCNRSGCKDIMECPFCGCELKVV